MRGTHFYFLAAALVVFLAGALVVSGCSKNEPTVTGTVLLNGQPLPKGSIRFIPIPPTTGSDAGAAIQEGTGTYRIEKGLTVGKYKVEIRGIRLNPEKKVFHPVTQLLIDAE